MSNNNQNDDLISVLIDKGSLKQDVYRQTYQTMKLFKSVIKDFVDKNQDDISRKVPQISLEYRDKGEFEMELKFAGDILLFYMHTNVFEFPRDHEVMKTSYIREDKKRSYCGMINIYNFLADSFKYNRENDIGYLIGRVFVNNENHYFIEGKREIGLLYNNFVNAVMDTSEAEKIIRSAILYTINFDLLTPPYESVKEVSVYEMQTTLSKMKMRTGKRLGFRFQGDHDEVKKETEQ